MLILFGFGLADYLVNLGECVAGELVWVNGKMSVLHYIIYSSVFANNPFEVVQSNTLTLKLSHFNLDRSTTNGKLIKYIKIS